MQSCYRKAALPQHITWRQLGHGTYVLAMEPSTNHDAGRFDARKRVNPIAIF